MERLRKISLKSFAVPLSEALLVLSILGCARPISQASATSTPEVEEIIPTDEIAVYQAVIEEAKKMRPDCAVSDVDTELNQLAAGIDTYTPRPIQGDKKTVDDIMELRQINREGLQKISRSILQTTDDRKLRSLMLSETYNEVT